MKKFALVAVLAALNGLYLHAQEAPKAPAPQKEHEWLKQLAGEWVTDAEAVMVPGQPPVKCKGSEKTRTLGGFWAVSETKSEFMGTPEVGQMTLGYDAQKKKFVGTWVCSMADYLWKYEGSLDSTGKILTLETEGPDMMAPGKMTKMKDVIEVKSPTHKTLTSYILGPDGKWMQFMTMNAHRKNEPSCYGFPSFPGHGRLTACSGWGILCLAASRPTEFEREKHRADDQHQQRTQ